MDGTSFANLDLSVMVKSAVVFDMVYAPPVTSLLRTATALGLRCVNGLGMLVGQGEAAFTIWTGLQSPPGVMKERILTFGDTKG
jgi:shikimate dehydrogenase